MNGCARFHGLLPIVVEEEKHGSERIHSCIPFLGGAMPVSAFMPRTKGRMAHNLQLASWKAGTHGMRNEFSLGSRASLGASFVNSSLPSCLCLLWWRSQGKFHR